MTYFQMPLSAKLSVRLGAASPYGQPRCLNRRTTSFLFWLCGSYAVFRLGASCLGNPPQFLLLKAWNPKPHAPALEAI
jgi:hypothetical protein